MDKYLGKRLDGRYEMRELIGVGGMAYVYKAYDNVNDRTVAVKILKDEFLDNEEFTRRFRNESKAIAILNHPNIVKVLDVGFGERLQYIVMEYIDGITLKEYLDQRKDIRWKEAVHFTLQILQALQHAHDKGIVHRDIKPQNIMLLSDGTIKVTDFGIARLSRNELRAATSDGEKAIGSVHYISPEQARGEITDEKADLYSVGVMLYEMLTGKLPFEAENAVSIAIMQMQSEPTMPREINPDIPEGLEQITRKAMQKDAGDRYQSAAEMLNDIDEFKRNPSIKFEYTYFVDEKPTRYVDAITRVRGEAPGGASGNEDKDAPENGRKVSSVAILAAIAAAILLVAVGFVVLFTKLFTSSGGKENITVDNFVGLGYNEEVLTHEHYHYYDFEIIQEYNDEYEYGKIFKQEPTANSTIKMGGKLTLYFSKGSKTIEVPQYMPGETLEMVRSKLGTDFVIMEVEEQSAEYRTGTVIRLEPDAGQKVAAGSSVTIYVSSGSPDAEPIEMPNVMAYNVTDATEKLVSAGFIRENIIKEEVNDKAPTGTVIGVTPNSGEQNPDITIVLKVSTGYQNVNMALELPDTEDSVSLQFFLDGQLDQTLTSKYATIAPKGILSGKINFTVGVTKENYSVIVKIAKAGSQDYKVYETFTVAGKNGTYTRTAHYPYAGTPTTVATTLPTTVPTTPTTAPTTPTVPAEQGEPVPAEE